MSHCKVALLAALISLPVLGEEPSPAATPADVPAATAEPAAAKWYEKIHVEALADAAYSYRLEGNSFANNILRVYDVPVNTFALNYAELAVYLPADPAGGRIDIGFGALADLGSVEVAGSGTSAVDLNRFEMVKHIQQAYASFKLPVLNGITIDVGRFTTSAGAEVIEAKDNLLYTRAVMYGYGLPFTHTGLRVATAVTDSLTIQLGVVNGWDVVFDNNKYKTLNLSVAVTAPSRTSLFFNLYAGPEGATSDVWRILADLVVSQSVGDSVTLVANANLGKEGDATWFSGLLMGRFAITESFRLAARFEYFGDPQGARTGQLDADGDPLPVSIIGMTASLGYLFGSNAELRLELRRDQASADVYAGGAGQTTLTGALLAWF